MTGFVLISIGCAECRGRSEIEGLVDEVRHFPTIEEAQKHVTDVYASYDRPVSWHPHPLGGVFYGSGSGDEWIAPVDVFSAPH